MAHRMQVNGYRGFHTCHTWIIFYAEEGNIGTKWRALEPMEGKSRLGLFKREMSPRLLVCCCQISVPENKVSFYRREEGGDVLRDKNDSGNSGVVWLLCHTIPVTHMYLIHAYIYTCIYIYMWHIRIFICTPVYPSLLFSTRINVLNPKKKIWHPNLINSEDTCTPVTHSIN